MSTSDDTTIRLGPLQLDFENPKRGIPGLGISLMSGEDGEQIGWAEPFREDDWNALRDVLRRPNPVVDGEYVALSGDEDVVIVEKLGTAAIRTQPHNELAVVMDVGGRLNKQNERRERRFIMSPEIAAELVADIVVSATEFPEFAAELDIAIQRERERRFA